MNTINEIADAVHENAVAHGFHPQEQSIHAFVANQTCNMHGELTEFWDSWRAGTNINPCDKSERMIELGILKNGETLNQDEEELADLIIRALDVSRRLKIDIQRCIEIKHAYNLTRPFKHGKLN